MGSRLFCNTTNLLGGHDFANAAAPRRSRARPRHRRRRASPAKLAGPTIRSSRASQSGKIKGLWIIGDQPGPFLDQPEPRSSGCSTSSSSSSCRTCISTTETAARAHLVLPAAGWGEKEGTFINSERRIRPGQEGRPRARARRSPTSTSSSSSPTPGAAASCSRDWTSPEAVFQLLKKLSARPALRHHRHRRLRRPRCGRGHPMAFPGAWTEGR